MPPPTTGAGGVKTRRVLDVPPPRPDIASGTEQTPNRGGAWARATATSPPATSGTGPTTTRSTAFPSRTTRRCSNGWCSRSTRPASPGSPSSRSARRSAAPTRGSIPRSWRPIAPPTGAACSPTRGSSATASRWTRPSPTPAGSSSCGTRTARSPAGSTRTTRGPSAEWVALFKQTFRFTGGEIVGEFLMSVGYLPGAHLPTCPAYRRIARLKPAWMRETGRGGTARPGRGARRASP